MIVREPGETGRLEAAAVPVPVPDRDEVLVKVHAVGVNYADLSLTRGMFGPAPRIPGLDVAGTIAALGSGVADLDIGARVVLNPAITCGACEYCRSGNDGTCRRRRAIGQALDGGYAEYVKIPATNVHFIGDNVTFEQAATIPSNYFTAWQMLFNRAGLQPGETVLISGAASGVGTAAAQIAQFAGARVIGAVGSSHKMAMLRQRDVTEIVNYNEEDYGQRVLELTGNHGADVIIDVIGAVHWPHYVRALRAGGRIVTCGTVDGRHPAVDIIDLIVKQMAIHGSGGSGSKLVAARVVDLLNAGRLGGHIDRVLGLSDAPAAHQAIAKREVAGKIVLIP